MIFNNYDVISNLSVKWKHIFFKKNALICKASILIFSSIILQLLGFVFRIEITRHSGTQTLAIYQLIMSAYNIIMAFSLQGVILAASRYSSQQLAMSSYSGLSYIKKLSKVVFIILFSAIFVPCLIFRRFVATNILGDSRTEMGLFFILLCIFLTGFENINKAIFMGTQKVFPTTVSEIGELIIRIISVVFLLDLTKNLSDEISASAIVIAMIISEISSVIYLAVKHKKTFGKNSQLTSKLIENTAKQPVFQKTTLKNDYLKTAIPVCFSGLLNKILISADTILLPQMLMLAGLSRENAMTEFAIIFSMTMPIVVLPSCVIISITSILMPKISEYCVTQNIGEITRKCGKILQLVGICAIPLFLILIFFASPLFNEIYSSDAGAKYAPILAFATIFEYYQIVSGSVLNGLGFSGRAASSVVAEGIIQLFFTVLLVPVLKMDGFIIGNVISTIVGALMNLMAVRKHAKIKFKLKNWVLNPLFASVISVLLSKLVFVALINFFNTIAALIFAIIVFVVIYLVILRLLGNKLFNYLKETLFEKKSSDCNAKQ